MDCSYVIVQKGAYSITIVLRCKECAIFDSFELMRSENCHYLLLKQYTSEQQAYRDFLRLIGKMCIKKDNSKYFAEHLEEDNRIYVAANDQETMSRPSDTTALDIRLTDFMAYIITHRTKLV